MSVEEKESSSSSLDLLHGISFLTLNIFKTKLDKNLSGAGLSETILP